MTNDDNFGPWIDWAGGECPIPDANAGELEVKFRDGRIYDGHHPFCYDWSHKDQFADDIIAYRVRIPADDLLRQAIDALRETYAALDLMPYTAMQTGLAGTKEWDRIYGERNAFGACDKARAVLAIAKERGL